MKKRLSHFNTEGRAQMVHVGAKPATYRVAVAKSTVRVKKETLKLLKAGKLAKGDAITTAKIAGIMAAKRTSDFIPMCHPLALHHVDIQFNINDRKSTINMESTVSTVSETGVEMEALTACSVAALTMYDMLKSVDKEMEIVSTKLVSKIGGKSDYGIKKPVVLSAAVLVASDSVSRNSSKDTSGQFIQERLMQYGIKSRLYIVPDETQKISFQLKKLCQEETQLIITTGGTGLGPRDVTVEATQRVIDREIPGVMEVIRHSGQKRTPYAMLSRGIAGQKGCSLIINMPGSVTGVSDALDAVLPFIFHSYKMMKGLGH